jgi:hypothetical protein
MGTVGHELLYWQDTPGTLQVGIDPGVEYTGLAFVSWPYGQIGTVRRSDLLPVLYDVLGIAASEQFKLKVAYEEPSPTNNFTWWQLGRACAIIDCWVHEWPDATVIDHRPCTAQQVRARVEKVPLLLDALEPLDWTIPGLSERLPVHAREALATLIR